MAERRRNMGKYVYTRTNRWGGGGPLESVERAKHPIAPKNPCCVVPSLTALATDPVCPSPPSLLSTLPPKPSKESSMDLLDPLSEDSSRSAHKPPLARAGKGLLKKIAVDEEDSGKSSSSGAGYREGLPRSTSGSRKVVEKPADTKARTSADWFSAAASSPALETPPKIRPAKKGEQQPKMKVSAAAAKVGREQPWMWLSCFL